MLTRLYPTMQRKDVPLSSVAESMRGWTATCGMVLRERLKAPLLVLVCLGVTLSKASAQVGLYGDDLAWKLANPGEIRKATSITARLKRETKEAPPLFILTPPPFSDIEAAPNKSVPLAPRPESWELPPWPSVGPPLPSNATDGEKAIYVEHQSVEAAPGIWPELDAPGGDKEAPDSRLRPRVVPLDEQFVFRIKEIPEPFSLRRYFDVEGVFIEIAAFGGTTSFKAEEAFRAIKETATRQTALQGIGEEAFLTRIEVEKMRDDPNVLPFSDIELQGEARPELLDSGSAQALTAPAFQEIAVKDLEGRKIRFVDPNRKYVSNQPEIEQSLLVLVAFFPDQAVTVSFAIDERLGSVQDLIALAMLAQRKLKDELSPRG